MKNLTEISLNPSQYEALDIVNSLQRSMLFQKFVKSDTTLGVIYQNQLQKQLIQKYIEEKTSFLLEIISDNELFLTPKDR